MPAAQTDRRKLLTIVGATLVVAGLLFGLLPVSTTTRGDDVSCGNPWFLTYDEQQALGDRFHDALTNSDSTAQGQEKCEQAAGSRGTIGFILGGLGGAVLLGTMFLGTSRREQA